MPVVAEVSDKEEMDEREQEQELALERIKKDQPPPPPPLPAASAPRSSGTVASISREPEEYSVARQPTDGEAGAAPSQEVQEVNPELLAPLPPDIQEEVLEQHRRRAKDREPYMAAGDEEEERNVYIDLRHTLTDEISNMTEEDIINCQFLMPEEIIRNIQVVVTTNADHPR